MSNSKICRLSGASLPEHPDLKIKNVPCGVLNFPREKELPDDRGMNLTLFSDPCGFVQLSENQVVYNDEITSYSAYSPSLVAHRREQVENFVSQFDLRGKSVLDVGCGDGHLLQILQASGVEAYGIEPSATSAEAARSKGMRAVSGFMGEKNLLPDGPFDAFVSFHVLEHIPDLKDFVRGIRTNLKPGGVGLIEVPCFEQVLEQSRFYDFFPDHLNYFSLRTLRLTMELHGFEILDAYRTWQGEHNVAIVRRLEQPDLAPLQQSLLSTVRSLEELVRQHRNQGRTLAVWGASSHALILLSQTQNLGLQYLIDSSPHKQGRFTPISHYKVHPPDFLRSHPVDVLLVIAPRFEREILEQVHQMGFSGTILTIRGRNFEQV